MTKKELVKLLESFDDDAEVKLSVKPEYYQSEFAIVEVHNSSSYDNHVWIEGN